jgi:hypothetical protein
MEDASRCHTDGWASAVRRVKGPRPITRIHRSTALHMLVVQEIPIENAPPRTTVQVTRSRLGGGHARPVLLCCGRCPHMYLAVFTQLIATSD